MSVCLYNISEKCTHRNKIKDSFRFSVNRAFKKIAVGAQEAGKLPKTKVLTFSLHLSGFTPYFSNIFLLCCKCSK